MAHGCTLSLLPCLNLMDVFAVRTVRRQEVVRLLQQYFHKKKGGERSPFPFVFKQSQENYRAIAQPRGTREPELNARLRGSGVIHSSNAKSNLAIKDSRMGAQLWVLMTSVQQGVE
jgi:hypothetical protein